MAEPTTGRILTTRRELLASLAGPGTGFVPTMGALHEGHRSLIRRASAENERTVVSVFVNPAQFDDPDDAAAYPRNLVRDAAAAFDAGANFVFAPPVDEVYPPGFATAVEVRALGERWEGAARPGHFRGVATIVAILLNLVRPDRAYFGEKDYQQFLVVRRLHADLALPGEIVGCPTIRDVDGLALSSRNARLSAANRERAGAVPRALRRMVANAEPGEADAARLVALGWDVLAGEPGMAVEYLAVVDQETLEPVETAVPGTRVVVAVRLGGVRLIDNIPLMPRPTAATAGATGSDRRRTSTVEGARGTG